jgi:hypothetical protein
MNKTIPHLRELPLRIGGVMRCCIETLDTALVTEVEGEILSCKYCDSSLRIRDGAWEWNQPTRKEIMTKAHKLGHCLCNRQQTCPCPTLKDRNVCMCAGEQFDDLGLHGER